MSTKSLGRLQKVELHEVWISESAGFTPWLAQPENMKLLGKTIGIDLECEAQEKEVISDLIFRTNRWTFLWT